jgi:hypothetical protein
MQEILKHKDAAGAQGDLARELISILEDYKSGALGKTDKDELVQEVVKIYAAQDHAEKEVMVRWAATAASIAISIV